MSEQEKSENEVGAVRVSAASRMVPEWTVGIWPLKLDDEDRVGMLVRKCGVEDRVVHFTPKEARILARDLLQAAGFDDAARVADDAKPTDTSAPK